MVEGVTAAKLAEISALYPTKEARQQAHLEGVLRIADPARFGTDAEAKEALRQIVLSCRCALL